MMGPLNVDVDVETYEICITLYNVIYNLVKGGNNYVKLRRNTCATSVPGYRTE
jgi:hypothetical protein